MYIKTNLKFKITENKVIEGFHRISIQISLSGQVFSVHGIYRPPAFPFNSFCDQIESLLASVADNHSCLIVGDFNVPINLTNLNTVTKYKSILESFGYVCTNSFPTRPKTNNILDHVISKQIDLGRLKNDTIFTDVSDHLQVITSFKLSSNKQMATLTKEITDHCKLNNLFLNYLNNVQLPDNVNVGLQDITTSYSHFRSMSTRTIKKNVKLKGNYCPWMSLDLWTLIKIKNNYLKRSKRHPDDVQLKQMLSHINKKLYLKKQECKKLYYERLLNNTPHSKLWRNINTLMGKNKPTTSINLSDEEGSTTNNLEVCEKLNRHFSTIGKRLAEEIPIDPGSDHLSRIEHVQNTIFLHPATVNEVRVVILSLKNKKGCGPDNFPRLEFILNASKSQKLFLFLRLAIPMI
ncbi:uncharacterized protein LOC129743052 [Uranotaenia lowii]|nr:uncharacterized protein LOC129743052 [Uranotaenia lowii]